MAADPGGGHVQYGVTMSGTLTAGLAGIRRLVIAEDRCKGCELCVAACPTHVLAIDHTRVNALGYDPVMAVHPDACTSCAICARVCPDVVFTVIAPARVPRPGVDPEAPPRVTSGTAAGAAA